MTPTTLVVAMIGMLGSHRPLPRELVTLRLIAAQIVLRSPPEIDPVLVAAVLHHESGFDANARSPEGDLGLGQLRRRTAATRGYDEAPDAVLLSIPINVSLVVRHLVHVRTICGPAAPPIAWLSVYSGRRHCRPSPYSRAVLGDYERGRAALNQSTEVAKR